MFLDLLSSVSFLLGVTGGALLLGGLIRRSLIRYGLILISSAAGTALLKIVGAYFGAPAIALLPIFLLLWIAIIAIFALFKVTK
ncbi:MAG: hypothetical protein AAF668_02450 [Pseudomonadota bacterium]